MSHSVKTNFIFNLVNTVAGLLFPLITFPYASRIMQADGIGLVNFYQSIITYITLLSSIGIPLYSIREIARVREDATLLNRTMVEIFLLHIILTVFGYAIGGILCLTIDEIQTDLSLFFILSLSILFTAIGCEWFYQGIEDFKYITIRSLIIKCIYVVLLFLLVKSKDDLMIYGVLTIFGTVGNNVFNFFRLRKYLDCNLINVHNLHPFKHFVPALKVFVLNLIISLYLNLNPVMLGFMTNVTAVGMFTAASKISHMLLGVFVALQNAVLPKTSNLLQNGEHERFKALTQKVMDFIFLFAFPLSVGLAILSPSVISILCGESYRPAARSLSIMSPIIFIIALSGLFGIQMLYPLGKEKIVIWSTSLGAIVNLMLNTILIPFWGYDGASTATLLAELTVTASMVLLGRKYLPLIWFSRHYFNCIFGSLLMGISCLFIRNCVENDILRVIIVSLIGIMIYSMWLFVRRDELFMDIIWIMKSKLKIV